MNGPTINVNGSRKCELLDQWIAVRKAAVALDEALGKALPNGRDWPGEYGPERLAKALEKHKKARERARLVYRYADRMVDHIMEQDA